jgi:hypothetical protein
MNKQGVGTMAITAEQRERLELLAAINTTQQAYANIFHDESTPKAPDHSQRITLTDSRVIDELRRRAQSQKIDYAKLIEDTLWKVFFPGESKGQKPVKLAKSCPICGSRNILEPENGFPQTCECLDCKATFDQPVWG